MALLSLPAVRQELLTRLSAAREETGKLFDILHPNALYDRPIPERHRIAFYIGHLEAFDWNLLREPLRLKTFDPDLDQLFAFGIDPVNGGLPTDTPDDWPGMDRIENYRTTIRRKLDEALLDAPEDSALADLLHIAIEHRLMHAETLEYMFHQLPYDRKVGPATPFVAAVKHSSKTMEVPAGRATLGLTRSSGLFGWDNEFDQQSVQLPRFTVDKYKVTNADYLKFVEAKGYQRNEFWSKSAWEWLSANEISNPVFWVPDGAGWSYRTMFDEVPLPLDWPVYVSQAEASAYAAWAGKALPTEAEWHRAAYGTSQGSERQFPWGGGLPINTRSQWNPSPVGAHPEQQSAFGVEDLLATGWEWTSTLFEPFPGFRINPAYPGYSANFFDGKHFVIKGGSTRTAACMLRRSFRNWFQPHYQYVYAGFRCVAQ